jgi:hypothetical protein
MMITKENSSFKPVMVETTFSSAEIIKLVGMKRQ